MSLTRSRLDCRACHGPLGYKSASGVFHRRPGVAVTYIDLAGGTVTLRCSCGVTTQYTGGAIAMEA
jgi:hypothetical protein